MPPLISLSPNILDQTFPRDFFQLSIIGQALGEIQQVLEKNQAHLIVTETLLLFVDYFDWNRTEPFPLLTTIYNLLNQWVLQTHERIILLDVGEVNQFVPHPIPMGTELNEYVQLWSEEMGKILVKHDECPNQRNFFIGIACERAFSGHEYGQYFNPHNLRAFPLIGPENLDQLDDAYNWIVPVYIRSKNIPFRLFLQNCQYIGATRVEKPRGDSHYHVYFNNVRWQLSRNDDPIPDPYLRELVDIVHLPLHVIKYLILERRYPEIVTKFDF